MAPALIRISPGSSVPFPRALAMLFATFRLALMILVFSLYPSIYAPIATHACLCPVLLIAHFMRSAPSTRCPACQIGALGRFLVCGASLRESNIVAPQAAEWQRRSPRRLREKGGGGAAVVDISTWCLPSVQKLKGSGLSPGVGGGGVGMPMKCAE